MRCPDVSCVVRAGARELHNSVTRSDFVVIGAGMAGLSVAYELGAFGTVTVIEREPQPGYHATGRSAAYFLHLYGNTHVRDLSAMSHGFLATPPAGFCETPLIGTEGAMFIARHEQVARLRELEALDNGAAKLEWLDTMQARARVPALRPDYLAAALFDGRAGTIDVHAVLQAYLKGMRLRGGTLVTGVEANRLCHTGGRWRVETGAETHTASVLVNAAGAWSDQLASLAGASAIGLTPMRRTAVLARPSEQWDVRSWPMVIDVDEQLYFKPDAGRLLVSPADETRSAPSDCFAEEWDVAVAIDRLERATELEITHIEASWAGLRTFAPDRSPVVGFDPAAPGFFWLAGQGGYGVQTAPALASLAAQLIGGGAGNFDRSMLSALAPGRFQRTV